MLAPRRVIGAGGRASLQMCRALQHGNRHLQFAPSNRMASVPGFRGIEPASCFLDRGAVLPGPEAKTANGLEQGMSEGCELIIDTRRNGRGDAASYEPSRSSPLSVKVSIRCEMLPSPRRSSLKRFLTRHRAE